MEEDRPLPPDAVPGSDEAGDAESDAVLPVVAEATTGEASAPAGPGGPRRELVLAREPVHLILVDLDGDGPAPGDRAMSLRRGVVRS